MDNNKDLQYSTENSVQCCVAAWMGGVFGEERIHTYVWLSPVAVHLKLPQLLTGYIPIQNKKLEKKTHLYAFFLFICLVIGDPTKNLEGQKDKIFFIPYSTIKKNYMSVLC